MFGKPFILTSENLINEIERKAKKIINLTLGGVKILPTQIDINAIIEKLK